MIEFEESDDEYLKQVIMLGRTPDSPEILMNNLRGDMRSIDARRDELADLVGYSLLLPRRLSLFLPCSSLCLPNRVLAP
jgi:hypothetical protein